METKNIIGGFALLLVLMLVSGGKLHAQQLIYTPINPSFGGSPLNGSWMQSEAQAEKTFSAPSSPSSSGLYGAGTSALSNFQSTLDNAVLSELSQKIVSQIFSQNALTAGHYQFGNYIVDINPASDGIHINIQDNLNGGSTSVIVPYY